MEKYFVVRRRPGPGWVTGSDLRSQPMWAEHASFMNGLAAQGSVVLGGVVGTNNHALLILNADSVSAASALLAEDPWSSPAYS